MVKRECSARVWQERAEPLVPKKYPRQERGLTAMKKSPRMHCLTPRSRSEGSLCCWTLILPTGRVSCINHCAWTRTGIFVVPRRRSGLQVPFGLPKVRALSYTEVLFCFVSVFLPKGKFSGCGAFRAPLSRLLQSGF